MKKKIKVTCKWSISIFLMLCLPMGLSAQRMSKLPEDLNASYSRATDADTDDKWDKDSLQIEGIVTDIHGETIIGATVVEKGNQANGVVTDIDGKFLLKVPPRSILVVSYIGYNTQETRVNRRIHTYNVVLKEDNQMLDEVVVVGYGTVKKSDLTGSVSTVGKRSFESQPVKNVSQILQGRTPGWK